MSDHRCSGCDHRWDGPLKGAELCGDCWRKAQPVVHGTVELDALKAENARLEADASQRKNEIAKLTSEVLHERDKVEEMARRADRYLVRAEAAEAREATLREALTRVTEGMDRAGGDGHGMPECPWCKTQDDNNDTHAINCELMRARAALTTQRSMIS